jgi:5-methylcytosine-specific restriction endonuclease McrA
MAAPALADDDRVCQHCGSLFRSPQTTATCCSRKCNTAKWRALNPDRMNVIRARASKASRKRRRKPVVYYPCADCSAPVLRALRCAECTMEFARTKAQDDWRKAMDLTLHARPTQTCRACRRTFKPTHASAKYCSSKCANAVRKPRHWIRQTGAASESVNAMAVFERDGWRCHMCRRLTPRSLRGPHKQRAPELDHIVPLSKGGNHTYANTACSCRECNGRKSNAIMGQPSLLAALQ